MILTIFYILAAIGGASLLASVIMFTFKAIYAGIWLEPGYNIDDLDTPKWKKYNKVFKIFLTIGVFFVVVAVLWLIILLIVSAVEAQII